MTDTEELVVTPFTGPAYPPVIPPNTRAGTDPLATNHPNDHNQISTALTVLTGMPGIQTYTSAQRDALTSTDLWAGRQIWNSDNLRHEWYDGAAAVWRALNPGSAGAYGYVAQTQSFSGSNISTAVTVVTTTFPVQAGRRYLVSGAMWGYSGASSPVRLDVALKDGASTIVTITDQIATNMWAATPLSASFAAGASSRTVTLTIQVTGSGGGVYNVGGGLLVVLDAGEDGQVSTPTNIVPPDVWNAAWGIPPNGQDMTQRTSSGIGAAAVGVVGSGLTVNVTAGRRYRVTLQWVQASFSVSTDLFSITASAGGTQVGAANWIGAKATAYVTDQLEGHYDATTTGSVLFNVQVVRVSGTGTMNIMVQGFYIEDIGPSNPVAPATWPPKNWQSEINYTQITAPVTVTSTTEASGTVCITTPAITFDGSTVMVEVFAPYVQPAAVAGSVVFVNLFEGATEIGRLGVVGNPAAGQMLWPFTGRLRYTPTAGVHTYTVTAYQVSGNGTFGAGAGGIAYLPAFIRITRA
jgi:hypothetical protein